MEIVIFHIYFFVQEHVKRCDVFLDLAVNDVLHVGEKYSLGSRLGVRAGQQLPDGWKCVISESCLEVCLSVWWPSVMVFPNESKITLLDRKPRTVNLWGWSLSLHRRFSVPSRLGTTLDMANDVSGVVFFFMRANCATWNSRVLAVSVLLRPSSFACSNKSSRLIVSGGDVR